MAKKTPLQVGDGELNYRESRFVEHYVSMGNATQAYIAAGYSRAGASVSAHQLLKRPRIIEAVLQEREKLQTIINFKREDHIRILHGIANARIDDFAGVDIDDVETFKNMGHKMHGVESFEHTRNGIKLKLRDQEWALSELKEILGYATAGDDKTPRDSTAQRILGLFRKGK